MVSPRKTESWFVLAIVGKQKGVKNGADDRKRKPLLGLELEVINAAFFNDV